MPSIGQLLLFQPVMEHSEANLYWPFGLATAAFQMTVSSTTSTVALIKLLTVSVSLQPRYVRVLLYSDFYCYYS